MVNEKLINAIIKEVYKVNTSKGKKISYYADDEQCLFIYSGVVMFAVPTGENVLNIDNSQYFNQQNGVKVMWDRFLSGCEQHELALSGVSVANDTYGVLLHLENANSKGENRVYIQKKLLDLFGNVKHLQFFQTKYDPQISVVIFCDGVAVGVISPVRM